MFLHKRVKRGHSFLMYRVELKGSSSSEIPRKRPMVPNVPCGVESSPRAHLWNRNKS